MSSYINPSADSQPPLASAEAPATLPLHAQIENELKRVVGAAGVGVHLESSPACPVLARIDTEESEWRMHPMDLLDMLRAMPDRAGILAMRQAADRHPRKIPAD